MNKKTLITKDDLEALAIGAALLGSGGGGDPAIDKLIAHRTLELHGPAQLLSVDDLKDDDFVVPIGGMGAPLICVEKIATGFEFAQVLQEIERYMGKKPTALMTVEIGGGNAFAPLTIASAIGLPILDADSLGRAFPELQMSSFNVHNMSPSPAVMVDGKGNCVVINATNAVAMESIARSVTVSFGSSAHIGLYTMSGLQAKQAVVKGSVSRAIALGNAVLQAQKNNSDPVHAILDTTQGSCIGTGIINDIQQKIEDGFLKGSVTIEDQESGNTLQLMYQNENLAAFVNNKLVASTPDIIIPIDVQTGRAITTESLSYGLRVAVIVMKSADIWYTPKGLQLVGPQVFGLKSNEEKI